MKGVFNMRQDSIFRGVATALITPMDENGVNYQQLKELIDWQIEEGIDGLVICGTTGEGSTLSDAEHKEVLRFSAEIIGGRVPLIAGTGSNDTAYAIEMTEYACEIGADAMLVVTPYYNKTTQRGLVEMFNAIADASTKPIILYNVPSRTGINIEPETYLELAKHPMITAIKEANGDLSKIVETMALIGDKLDLYSGNDDQIQPLLALGGSGVISVLSNLLPAKTREICTRYFEGDIEGSAQEQFNLLPLTNALFSEVNPIPVKAAMAKMGFCENYVRLPLTTMDQNKAEIMYELMKEQGISLE